MPHEIIMPVLGMNQDTGSIACWNKKPGDYVEAGDVVMDVETDKAVMEIEAKQKGYLTKIFYEAGCEVPVGDVVALIEDKPLEEKATPAKEKPSENIQKSAAPTVEDPNPPSTQSTNIIPLTRESVPASPKAKNLARQKNISLKEVSDFANKPVLHAVDVDQYINRLQPDTITTSNTQTIEQSCGLVIETSHEGFKQCEQWLLNQESDKRNAGHLLATMAAQLMRSNKLYENTAPLIVKVVSWDGKCISSNYLVNPDIVRFSMLEIHEEISGSPSLHVFYLSGSHITEIASGMGNTPSLILTENDKQFKVQMSGFSPEQLPALVRFAEHLAQAIQQPLLHLT